MDFREFLKENIVVFDGAMGTMMQRMGLQAGELPELLNMTHPEMIRDIHRQYVEAGSHVVSTNTFQASEYKLKNCGYTVEEIISRAVSLAKESGARFTALDVGPVGQLMEPLGPLTFQEAYDMFRRQMAAGEKAGADLIIVETMSDIYEVKAALLAAREHTSLPVILSLTYQADGRTFTGTDPVTATLALQGMEPDALGLNCSMGPRELLPVAEKILRYSKLPVIVQANAGLPEIIDEETVYTITPEGGGRGLSRALCPSADEAYLVLGRVRLGRPLTLHAVGRWPDRYRLRLLSCRMIFICPNSMIQRNFQRRFAMNYLRKFRKKHLR